jgi:hypothetical protein
MLMKVEFGNYRNILPFALAGALALSGCGKGSIDKNASPIKVDHETTKVVDKRHSRVVNFKAKLPIVLLTVSEACDEGTMVKSTNWVVRDHDSKYTVNATEDIFYHSPGCDGNFLTAKAMEEKLRPHMQEHGHIQAPPVDYGTPA